MSKTKGHLITNLLIESTIEHDGGLDPHVNWLLVELEATVLTPMADYKSTLTRAHKEMTSEGSFFLALLMSWRLKLPAVAGTIVYQLGCITIVLLLVAFCDYHLWVT
jgi:hypothetical protein